MEQLIAGLLPEMLGLVATPAAIVACVLLLDTERGLRNVVLFAAAFLTPYVVLSALVVAVGGSSGVREGAGSGRAWISLVVGVLFVVGGVVVWLRKPPAAGRAAPGWVQSLTRPKAGGLVVTGLALSVLNPNVAILLSGLSTVLALAADAGQRALGVVLLLASALLDFVVPALVYALLGARGAAWLATAKTWLVSHDRVILVVVLLLFGIVFAVRGLSGL